MGRARQVQVPAIPRWIFWPSVIVVLVTYVVPGIFSAYRAWVQVRSLELSVPRVEIHSGDTVRVRAVSWARTRVRFDLQLVQDDISRTLEARVIPDNPNPSIDPRWRRDSIVVVMTETLLSGYEPGAAIVRATAIGGPQWLRTPPPLIRETAVTLASPVAHRGRQETRSLQQGEQSSRSQWQARSIARSP